MRGQSRGSDRSREGSREPRKGSGRPRKGSEIVVDGQGKAGSHRRVGGVAPGGRVAVRVPAVVNLPPRGKGGSACCDWNGHGRNVTTQLDGLTSRL